MRSAIVAAALSVLCALPSDVTAAEPAAQVDEVLQNISTITRPGRVGYATVWDGNKYVQCRRLSDRALRCEAAGSVMQPSLGAVLTPERIVKLTSLGWSLDPSFGNYVRTFPADLPTASAARQILEALTRGYDADTSDLDTATEWVLDLPCPPRNGPSQNLAGMVNDARSMRATAIRACAYTPAAAAVPAATREELVAQYGGLVAAELQRLRINARQKVYAVFDAGIGYVQCAPKSPTRALYCEAQSAQSWPALAAVLTPERVARLQAAGFALPGRAPNYWRDYALGDMTDQAVATEILSVLYDVYGYVGATTLKITTEQTP